MTVWKGKHHHHPHSSNSQNLIIFKHSRYYADVASSVSSKRVCISSRSHQQNTLSILQELPKYLRGYHACTREETIRIAALLFTIKVNNDKSQFVMIPRMLKELVPSDQLKSFSENEWKKVWRTMLFINSPCFHLNPMLLFCPTYYICALCVLHLC